MDETVEVLKGTLDVLILSTLAWGPAHGYAVARWIKQTTDDAVRIEEGALYPALHRLERKGWVESEWGLSETNRRAKYYRLTQEGRAQLSAGSARWRRFVEVVAKVLDATDAPAWAEGR
jgi:transcriptional regulator